VASCKQACRQHTKLTGQGSFAQSMLGCELAYVVTVCATYVTPEWQPCSSEAVATADPDPPVVLQTPWAQRASNVPPCNTLLSS
jgi:hypothetical protein